MIRRIVGLCLWWLAFTPALSLLHLGYPVAVCLWPVVGLGCIEASIKPIRICGAALFVSGLLAMLYITQDRWLLPPAIWGVLFVLGIAVMRFAGIYSGIQYDKPDEARDIAEARLSRNALWLDIKFPFKRLLVFYFLWMIGIVWIAFSSAVWAPVVLIAWLIVMMLLGYYAVWPYAVHPEWLGYITRRGIFVSKNRWRFRFVTAGLGVLVLVAAIWLYLSNIMG